MAPWRPSPARTRRPSCHSEEGTGRPPACQAPRPERGGCSFPGPHLCIPEGSETTLKSTAWRQLGKHTQRTGLSGRAQPWLAPGDPAFTLLRPLLCKAFVPWSCLSSPRDVATIRTHLPGLCLNPTAFPSLLLSEHLLFAGSLRQVRWAQSEGPEGHLAWHTARGGFSAGGRSARSAVLSPGDAASSSTGEPHLGLAGTSAWGPLSSVHPRPRPVADSLGLTPPNPPRAASLSHHWPLLLRKQLLPGLLCQAFPPLESLWGLGSPPPSMAGLPGGRGEKGGGTRPVRLPDCLSPTRFLSKPAGVHECCVAWLGHPHVLISSNFEVIPQLPHSQVGELLCPTYVAVPAPYNTRPWHT